MREFTLSGDTDTKLKAVEIIIGRLINRINSRAVTAFLTNSHIHGYIEKSDESGIIIRDMFAIGGMLTYVYLYIEQVAVGDKERKETELAIAIERKDKTGLSKGILVREGYQEAPLQLAIEGGSRVIIKSSKPLRGVWYGLVIDPVPQSKVVEYTDEAIVASDIMPTLFEITSGGTL